MEETINTSVFDELEQQPTFEHASSGQRFCNYIIDLAVYYVFNIIVAFVIGVLLVLAGKSSDEVRDIFSNRLLTISMACVDMFLIYTLVEGITKGRSLGKIITKTRAVSTDMAAISWKQAAIRTLSRMVPFEPVSALDKSTPWHDKWSKTMVIKNRQHV